MLRMVTLSIVSLSLAFCTAIVSAALPAYDHVVIVVEENHSYSDVIGSASAPYINTLATSGANFTNIYGITHPSQPNYLHLFSGSQQGVFDNSVPGSFFTTANLGAEMLSLFPGTGFGGYSDGLPAVGSNVASNGSYMRKHNPWVNWQGGGANQLPATVNMPFTSFPSNFTLLPKVSIVVPNQLNDMHDGTIGSADAWLVSNIKPYADWAVNNNSVLVLTWDEDSGSSRNRIPTIFYGSQVATGSVPATYTLHNLLRTVEDIYGTGHAGSAANVRAVTGAFVTDPSATRLTFQQGVNGYADVQDTYIEAANPATVHSAANGLVVDGDPLQQGLIRFDNLIGNGPGQVPAGATILSAKLRLTTTTNNSNDSMSIHRMFTDWSDSSTWSSLGSGVDINDVEAASVADFGLIPDELSNFAIFDVTSSIQSWANGAANFGWLLRDATGTDGWLWASSEAALGDSPVLDITFTVVPEPGTLTLAGLGVAGLGFVAWRKKKRWA